MDEYEANRLAEHRKADLRLEIIETMIREIDAMDLSILDPDQRKKMLSLGLALKHLSSCW